MRASEGDPLRLPEGPHGAINLGLCVKSSRCSNISPDISCGRLYTAVAVAIPGRHGVFGSLCKFLFCGDRGSICLRLLYLTLHNGGVLGEVGQFPF